MTFLQEEINAAAMIAKSSVQAIVPVDSHVRGDDGTLKSPIESESTSTIKTLEDSSSMSQSSHSLAWVEHQVILARDSLQE